MNPKFYIVLKCIYYSYLQIIDTLCQVKFEIINIRLTYFLSLWSRGQFGAVLQMRPQKPRLLMTTCKAQ